LSNHKQPCCHGNSQISAAALSNQPDQARGVEIPVHPFATGKVMMPDRIFDERERGFEAQFAFEEETRFRKLARRDKLFAIWAAERMHMDDPARAAFYRGVLQVEGWPRHDDALQLYVGDVLTRASVGLPPEELARSLARCAEEAHRQLAQVG
jgi:hypothetical protein